LKEGLELLNKLQQFEDKIVEIKNIIEEIPLKIGELEKERDSEKKNN